VNPAPMPLIELLGLGHHLGIDQWVIHFYLV
jgi:hypothetical protein